MSPRDRLCEPEGLLHRFPSWSVARFVGEHTETRYTKDNMPPATKAITEERYNPFRMKTETKVIPQSQRDLINNEGIAIQETVAWHTVSLITDKGKSIGTGSAILWGERPLILTANHVVKDSPDDDIWFHFRHDDTMKWAPLNDLHSHPDMK